MYFDVYYLILVLPAVLLAALASANVNSTFNKYSKVMSARRMTGADAARRKRVVAYNMQKCRQNRKPDSLEMVENLKGRDLHG